MKVPYILTYMVIWINCHLNPSLRLVIKSGKENTKERLLIKAKHLIGLTEEIFLVKKIQSTNTITYK